MHLDCDMCVRLTRQVLDLEAEIERIISIRENELRAAEDQQYSSEALRKLVRAVAEARALYRDHRARSHPAECPPSLS